jgi:hypothetical protein
VHLALGNDIGHAASTLNALGTLAALQASYGNATLASLAVLATVAADGAAAQVAAQGVGNTIASNAASAHSVLLSGATSYLASIAATVTAMLATETLGVRYAAATAYNTRLSAGPGGIMIAGEAPAPATGTGGLAYGGGAGRPGSGATTLPGIGESAAILSYTAQRLGGPAAGGVGSQDAGAAAGPGAAMVQELQALRAAVLALQATTQQGAVLVAQETRASGQAVAGALDDQTTLMRREAA